MDEEVVYGDSLDLIMKEKRKFDLIVTDMLFLGDCFLILFVEVV